MGERRLVFGEVADLYDRYRPTYPDRLIDDLVALARLDRSQAVLEVGAGTGKATVMFAARGMRVVAVEPSPAMAAVARRNCSAYPDVEIEQADFEQWDPGGRRFPLVFSAQAWHWEGDIGAVDGLTDAEIRYYDWEQDYAAGDYVGQLATLSEIGLMQEAHRTALLSAVAAAIDAHGEPLTLPMRTRLCLARRT